LKSIKNWPLSPVHDLTYTMNKHVGIQWAIGGAACAFLTVGIVNSLKYQDTKDLPVLAIGLVLLLALLLYPGFIDKPNDPRDSN
jgi:hypothetical protein